MIIAVTGLKRSGKNTVSHFISQKYGYTEYAFAKPIKEACEILFDWNPAQIELEKEKIDPRWGISPRQALQWLGTDAFQYHLPSTFEQFKSLIGRSFWIRKFENEMVKYPGNYVVSDFRFPHEAEYLKSIGAITIKVVRPSLKNMDLHESESYIDTLECDHTLINDSSVDALYNNVFDIMASL